MDAALVAVIAGVPSAIVAALASYSRVRRQTSAKIQELKVAYDQKRHSLYLETVKAHIKDIYLPINQHVFQLATAFKSMKNVSNFKEKEINPRALDIFKDKFAEYNSFLDDLRNKGHDAFIPDDLDYQLVALADFLRESTLGAKGANKIKITVVPEVGAHALTSALAGSAPISVTTLNLTAVRSFLRNLGGEPGLVAEVTASPLWHHVFEQQFLRHITAIKRHVREATLFVGGRQDIQGKATV